MGTGGDEADGALLIALGAMVGVDGQQSGVLALGAEFGCRLVAAKPVIADNQRSKSSHSAA